LSSSPGAGLSATRIQIDTIQRVIVAHSVCLNAFAASIACPQSRNDYIASSLSTICRKTSLQIRIYHLSIQLYDRILTHGYEGTKSAHSMVRWRNLRSRLGPGTRQLLLSDGLRLHATKTVQNVDFRLSLKRVRCRSLSLCGATPQILHKAGGDLLFYSESSTKMPQLPAHRPSKSAYEYDVRLCSTPDSHYSPARPGATSCRKAARIMHRKAGNDCILLADFPTLANKFSQTR
jgi:hypothetical protein